MSRLLCQHFLIQSWYLISSLLSTGVQKSLGRPPLRASRAKDPSEVLNERLVEPADRMGSSGRHGWRAQTRRTTLVRPCGASAISQSLPP